jgi:hypothetical protein
VPQIYGSAKSRVTPLEREKGRRAEEEGLRAGHELDLRRCVCDNPPRKIPYYHLNLSTLVIKQ